MWKPNLGKTTNAFLILCKGLHLVYQHQLDGSTDFLVFFSLAPTRRRLWPPCLYQHLLDGSTNSLLYRNRPEGSFDSLPCTTLPPRSMNQLTIHFSCSAPITMSLHILTPLYRILDLVWTLSPYIYMSNISCHCRFLFTCLVSTQIYLIIILV